jgi:hypothetical protein
LDAALSITDNSVIGMVRKLTSWQTWQTEDIMTVDGWCVLRVFFPSCHRRSSNLNLLNQHQADMAKHTCCGLRRCQISHLLLSGWQLSFASLPAADKAMTLKTLVIWAR